MNRDNDAVFAINEEGDFIYVNQRAADLLGTPAARLLHQPAESLLPDALCEDVSDALRSLSADEGSSFSERRMKLGGACLDVRTFAAASRVTVFCAETAEYLCDDRAPIGFQDLAKGDRLFHALAGQPVSGVFILIDGSFSYVNPEFIRIFGYSADELIGKRHFLELVAEEDRALMGKLIRRRIEAVGHGPATIRAYRSDGVQVDLDVYGSQLDCLGRPAFLGMAVDTTERRRAAAALREREEQLRHAQKLEAVGRLAGGIAHDFNNLLMVIRGSANLILMADPSESAQKQHLLEIIRATQRAAGLTGQLLAFGRKQVLRPKLINLNIALSDLHQMMRRLIGEDIELILDPGAQLGCVRVDPGQMEQVLLNLLVNSRDAMPRGGRITIHTSNTQLTQKDAARFPYRVVPGPYVCLTVEDTGEGMSEAILARVFEPFFTTKEQGKGSGLGLSMVYGIVKQSGGYVWASSTPGRGARFEIYLPKVEGTPDPRHPPKPAQIARGSGTVLLVEDEEQVRLVTRRLLEHGGYTVVEAGGGPEAIRCFDEHQGSIDLLLTDVVMPRMGGGELADQLLRREPSLRVLFMSGYANDRGLRRGLGKKDHAFLEKPFSAERLLERIETVLSS